MKALNSKLLLALTIVGCAIILTNCTHSSDDSISIPFPQAGPDVVQEQKLSGQYVSSCVAYPLGGMRTISLSINNDTATLVTTLFNGTDCSNQSNQETLAGHLEDDGSSNGIYLVKLTIPLSSNSWTWVYYKMQFAPGVIAISDSGLDPSDLTNVVPSINLYQQTSTPPPAAPILLQSGDYAVVSGSSQICGQNIGTATVSGAIVQVYVTYAAPCSGTVSMTCQSNVCSDDSARITFESPTSYRYDDLTNNWSAQLQIQQ